MSTDEPTTTNDNDDEYRVIRDIDIEKEQFLRGYLIRQREIHRKELQMVADLSQANTELILANGLVEVAARRASKIVKDTKHKTIESLTSQRVKREEATENALQHLHSALNPRLIDGNFE